jgi:hypothetical protein
MIVPLLLLFATLLALALALALVRDALALLLPTR